MTELGPGDRSPDRPTNGTRRPGSGGSRREEAVRGTRTKASRAAARMTRTGRPVAEEVRQHEHGDRHPGQRDAEVAEDRLEHRHDDQVHEQEQGQGHGDRHDRVGQAEPELALQLGADAHVAREAAQHVAQPARPDPAQDQSAKVRRDPVLLPVHGPSSDSPRSSDRGQLARASSATGRGGSPRPARAGRARAASPPSPGRRLLREPGGLLGCQRSLRFTRSEDSDISRFSDGEAPAGPLTGVARPASMVDRGTNSVKP